MGIQLKEVLQKALHNLSAYQTEVYRKLGTFCVPPAIVEREMANEPMVQQGDFNRMILSRVINYFK